MKTYNPVSDPWKRWHTSVLTLLVYPEAMRPDVLPIDKTIEVTDDFVVDMIPFGLTIRHNNDN